LWLTPRIIDSQFVCDLEGAAGREYQIGYSTDLTAWNDLVTLTNATGTITFTNSLPPGDEPRFYRALLVP